MMDPMRGSWKVHVGQMSRISREGEPPSNSSSTLECFWKMMPKASDVVALLLSVLNLTGGIVASVLNLEGTLLVLVYVRESTPARLPLTSVLSGLGENIFRLPTSPFEVEKGTRSSRLQVTRLRFRKRRAICEIGAASQGQSWCAAAPPSMQAHHARFAPAAQRAEPTCLSALTPNTVLLILLLQPQRQQ